MKLTTIREIYKNREAYLDKEVTVGGWVRSVRDSKTFGFIVLHDGSYFETLQIVYHDEMENFAEISKMNAAAATQHLISKYAPQAVVFSGIAGGLNPKLHIDDVVIGKRLRYLDTDTALIAESAPGLEEFGSTPALVDIAADVLAERGFVDASTNAVASNEGTKQFLVGTIATGNRFVTGAAMRNDAIEATHADCVGMEGAAIAHVATKNGVDCLVLRAISDNCDEAYDAICEREFDLFEYARVASDITLDIVRRIAAAQ